MRLVAGLLACMIILFAPRAAAVAPTRPQPPSILLILTDDQGYGDLSIHGNPYVKTPHIDSLAKAGVRFDRFYVNSFCAPTRAALLTGRYPLRTGVWGVTHNKEVMRSDEVTLAESLAAAGYRTACIGKWHNGEQYPYTPQGQGFHEFFGFHNGHINNYFNTALLRGTTLEKTRGYITDVLTDEAIRFVEKNRDRPFFCYLAYNAPHSPFQVADRYYDKFKAQGLDEKAAAFYGMCENIDDNVGRLLAALDQHRLADNTIVLFMTDNGGTAGVRHYNAGMRGGKGSVHEGGCRVPLFIRWPAKLTQPRTVTRITSHIDIYPTLLDLCGVTPLKGPPLDGLSLRPLLEGREQTWPNHRVLFTHHPTSESNRYPGAVRTDRYRLVREVRTKGDDATAGRWQLYDMLDDPEQKKDLARERPHLVDKLVHLYEAWFDDVSRGERRRLPIPVGHSEENPVRLFAPQAYFSAGLRFFAGPGFAHDYLTGWTDAKAKVWFDIDVVEAGDYEIILRYGCPAADAGSWIRVSVGDAALEVKLPAAEAKVIPLPHRDAEGHKRYVDRDWGTLRLGRLRLNQGSAKLLIEAASLAGAQLMDFKELELKRLPPPADAAKLRGLIIDGQNNHDWRSTTPIVKAGLERSGLFMVDVSSNLRPGDKPGRVPDTVPFPPDLEKYDLVVSNYNGQPWPADFQKTLVARVREGKLGLVIFHAANNPFAAWPEFNDMIGMGWRKNDFGEGLYVDAAGKLVRMAKGEGRGAGETILHPFKVTVRDREHPITKGLPAEWLHASDQLVHGLRGPARNVHVLATAYSDKGKKGTGEHELMAWTVNYDKGRVFHTPMGHGVESVRCMGFQTLLWRGAEWAATGKVTLPVPKEFPSPDEIRLLEVGGMP